LNVVGKVLCGVSRAVGEQDEPDPAKAPFTAKCVDADAKFCGGLFLEKQLW
jgi:hypothetical protein